MKEFSKWTIEEVEETFQLLPLKHDEVLAAWLQAECPLSTEENKRLSALSERLREHVHDWNEEELKMYFISPLLDVVDYLHADYQAFFERTLSVTLDGQRLSGVVDCLIATGRRSPKRPIFCLHEYKPERHSSNDPLGQIAVAMVAAQHLNNDAKPVYGAYLIGGFWYFLVLHHTTYAVSFAQDATKEDDVRQIFHRLKYIKQLIEQELGSHDTRDSR